MMNNFKENGFLIVITILFKLATPLFLTAQTRDVAIIVHLHGVYESKIDLLSLSGTKQFKSFVKIQGIKNSETAKLTVPKENLPGEFVLRFDYKKKEETSPYPCEKSIIINDQDLELWVNPVYCNNSDSTWFQQGERENSTFALFTKENSRRKEKLEILQQFLMNYDDTKSKFYRQGIEEYEQRRQAYNQWLDTYVTKYKALFVSRMFGFQYLPQINWEGTEKERMLSVIRHYFDKIDFNDPVIVKTSQLKDWMDHYVNLYGQMATSVTLRDSLIPAAAKIAIEKARQGHPLMYGWMVDYFYKGFESNNIPDGMKVLEPYMNDPNCLTSKRMEIERRLKGIETLVKGSKAPDIFLKDSDSSMFELYNYKTSSKYILLLFWSAECPHCQETVDELYPWQNRSEIRKKMSVVAISLDETDTEVKAWDQKIKDIADWKHLRAVEGVRSKVASDYFVLSTPVMILINAKTKEIISLPSNFSQLQNELP